VHNLPSALATGGKATTSDRQDVDFHTEDRAWTLQEFRILHQLQRSIAVVEYDRSGCRELPEAMEPVDLAEAACLCAVLTAPGALLESSFRMLTVSSALAPRGHKLDT